MLQGSQPSCFAVFREFPDRPKGKDIFLGADMDLNMYLYGMRIVCILCFFITLAACDAERSDHTIFRFNQVQGVESLDPAFAKNLNIMWHIQAIYNRLIEYDENLNIQPSLAKTWSISADRTTYTFQLRTDVWFQDNEAFPNGRGRRMTSYDVVYSFERILDPEVASPGAWIFNGHVDTVQPFVAVNDSVFEIHLQHPFNPMMGILSMQYCSVVPHEVVEKWGTDFRSHPCGTGPFQLQHWEESVALTYRRNPRYWEVDDKGIRLPYVDGLKVTQVDSKASEFLMFMQGKIDFMNGFDAAFKDQVLNKQGQLKADYVTRIAMQKRPYLNVEYLGILMDSMKQPQRALLYKKLRQAINYGFDRRKLIMYLRNNISFAAESGIIPRGLAGYDSSSVKGYTYQPEKARQLINEVKAELGQLPKLTLLSNDNYSDRCNFIASQLGQLGLSIQVEIMQPSLLREQMSNKQAPFFWATWIADYPDAEVYLSMFYGKNDAPPNYTRFKNAEFDAYYERSLTTSTEQERIQLYQQMDRILIEEAPCIPLFYDEIVHFLQKNVSNWTCSSLNMPDWKRIRLKPSKH